MTRHSSSKKKTAKGTEYPAACSYCGLEFDKIIEYREHLSYHAKLKRLLLNRSRKKSQKSSSSTKSTAKDIYAQHVAKALLKIHCLSDMNAFIVEKDHSRGKSTVFSSEMQIYCSGIFVFFAGNLRAHVSRTHTKLENAESALRCPHCPCVFKRVATLNGHVTRVHSQSTPEGAIGDRLSQGEWGAMVEDEEEEEEETEESKVVGEVLKRLKQLNDGDTEPENERRYEKIDDVRWYFCGLSAKCNKKFKKPSDLIRHIRVHTRDKPFKCSLCGASFTLKSSLEYHTITHSYSVLKRTLKTKTKKSK
nr:unnamed protein product [Callosobruchus analis]